MRALLLFLSLSATAAFAQQPDRSWDRLSSVRPGQIVHVHPKTGPALSGEFRTCSADAITITRDGADQSITRADIAKVSLRTKARRARNVGIGAAIGAGTGAALMTIALVATGGSDSTGPLIGFGLSAGAAVGAGVGALFPGYQTLYRAP